MIEDKEKDFRRNQWGRNINPGVCEWVQLQEESYYTFDYQRDFQEIEELEMHYLETRVICDSKETFQ